MIQNSFNTSEYESAKYNEFDQVGWESSRIRSAKETLLLSFDISYLAAFTKKSCNIILWSFLEVRTYRLSFNHFGVWFRFQLWASYFSVKTWKQNFVQCQTIFDSLHLRTSAFFVQSKFKKKKLIIQLKATLLVTLHLQTPPFALLSEELQCFKRHVPTCDSNCGTQPLSKSQGQLYFIGIWRRRWHLWNTPTFPTIISPRF